MVRQYMRVQPFLYLKCALSRLSQQCGPRSPKRTKPPFLIVWKLNFALCANDKAR